MNLIEFSPKALAFASFQPTPQDDLIHAALGLTSDTGELVECLANHALYDMEFDRVNAVEEMGDVLWFANLASSVLGQSLQTSYITALETPGHQGLSQTIKVSWLVIETARIADQVKAHAIYGKPLNREEVLFSIGQVVVAIQQIAASHDISLAEILEANIAKLTKRYGAKFSKEAALNRDKEAEREAISQVSA